MSFRTHMTAARNGDFNYDSKSRSRSRAQARRLRTGATCGSTTSWIEVSDVRNTIQQQAVGYNYSDTSVVVNDDPYADLRDCMI